MDFFTKKTMFRKPRYPNLKFKGDKRVLSTCVILALEAKRLLHKRCEAYLAHVVDKSTLEVALDNVPVVQEFLDVFLKELSGLPSDRELEFGIELLPSLAPVFIPLYKMAPTELK